MRFPITQVCRPQELPRAACLFWRPLVEEILVVRIVQRVELVLGADAAVQRLAVAPLLNVLQAAGDAAVAVGVERIKVRDART